MTIDTDKIKKLSSDRQPGIGKANKRKSTKIENLLLKPDPVLKKYLKRGEGYDFSNITKEDKEYLEKKRKQSQLDESTFAKGGEVKKYMGGGSVHKKKNKMLTTKGWGASRKT
jgi:hypothetical protein